MHLYYDPLDKACKSRIGAIEQGSDVTFHICNKEGGEDCFSAEACFFVFFRDGEIGEEFPMERVENGFALTLKFNTVGLWFYHFRLVGCKDEFGNFPTRFLGLGGMRKGEISDTPRSWQLTVFHENYTTPEWFKGGVMYQIFPDRFYKKGDYPVADGKILRTDWGGMPIYQPNHYGKVLNNDFFGGNLSGITAKLDYLQALNVSVIYLNPIFEAYSNHRYDTGDYTKIDSLLGTQSDFEVLIREAEKRGIRIILDGVFNHTGDDSRYFNKYGRYQDELGAHQSPNSKYSDWYRFICFPDLYESWWGIDTLPAINERSESYQEFLFGKNGVLKHWSRCGIAGFRLDVADELPDFFLQKLRIAVKEENPQAMIIGEVWEDASNKIAYDERRQYLWGNELDSVMNYPLKNAIINFLLTRNSTQLRETIAMLIDHYPTQTLNGLMNILGTHDTVRILTVLGGKECRTKDEMAQTVLSREERLKAIRMMKTAIFLQFTLPGTPCIYYGDEIGMEGYQDPFCRRCFDWQQTEPELTDLYKQLGKLRLHVFRDVFSNGTYSEIFADKHCIVYKREFQEKRLYCFVNESAERYRVRINGNFRELLTQTDFCDELEILAYSFGILQEIK